jgi:GNAT superfamily N-acetyltransferase
MKMHGQGDIRIVKLDRGDVLPMSLLLLADEAVVAIERYIYECDVYVLVLDGAVSANEGPVGVFALYRNSPEEVEVKNMAVIESLQGKGLGSYMLGEVQRIAVSEGYRIVIVGTATVGRQLGFYIKNGFLPAGVRKDFFSEHYPEPIYEEGERLRDMVVLEKRLGC